MLRRYGLRGPSPADHRDLGVARLLAPHGSITIPPAYSLLHWLGDVRDQGSEGSCTGQAGAGMLDFNLRRWCPDFRGDSAKFVPSVSAQYIYARERMLDGVPLFEDSGSYGRTACKVLQKFGACPEPDFPYIAGQYSLAPTPEQDSEAATLRLGAYHRLTSVDDMKHCIASDYVFIVGFDVRESFETKTGGTGVYDPKRGEQSLGGHEVLFYAYDDGAHGGAFKVRNSWGHDWAEDGDFWFTYRAAADTGILHDAFVQHYGVWR